jgi:hypothetical protein
MLAMFKFTEEGLYIRQYHGEAAAEIGSWGALLPLPWNARD